MTSWLDALPGEGEMLRRLRRHDWSCTPLGPVDEWPERLRASVSLAMSSRFPLMVAWGPDLVQIYNDGYLPIFGEKHPQLGVPIRDTWPEIWHVVGPLLQGVLTTREATWAEDQQLWIDRLGFPEDTYFTFSYSPVLDAEGTACGVLATAVETTAQVISARRAAVLGSLTPAGAADARQAAEAVVRQLADHPADVPFALVYLRDEDGGHTREALTGAGAQGAPQHVAPGDCRPWPLLGAADGPLVVDVVGEPVLDPASGAAVTRAAVIGLGRLGALVCGLSPGRRVDDAHLAFLAALGVQVQAALAVGRAFADQQAVAEERVAAARAVSEREALERSLAIAERFRFAGAQVGTWTLDLRTGQAFLDENLELMFGVAPGTMHGVSDVLARIDPRDHPQIREALDRATREGGEFFVDFGVELPDGTRRAFQSRGTVAPGQDGRPRMLHGALWDATQILEAQAAARESEERLSAALEAAPWGSALVEPDGTITRVNGALCELLGRPSEVLLQSDFWSLLHPDDGAGAGLSAAGTGTVREVRMRSPQGGDLWVSLSSAPVRAADGRVLHFVVHVHDHTDRKQLEADLQRLADHDSLTGLLNRRRFGEELDRALKESTRFGDGAVLMLDMDGLKHANDTLGHAVGDALLVGLADSLRTRLRETDVCARLGGDEFAVVLPGTAPAAALALAGEVAAQFGRTAPLGTAVSVSIGIARLRGERGRTGEEVMTEVDSALYAAKDAGRGQVRVFEPGPADSSAARPRRWTDRIRTALQGDGFVLQAQPILALRGDDPVDRAELLLRMVGDDGRLLLPTSFLLAAERSTLILDIDRWVVAAAVRELAARQRSGRATSLSVNLSARSITDPGLSRFVLGEVAAAGADARGLVFEITETAAVVNVAQAGAFIRAVAEAGCELSLDDFGAGFTSFQYLKLLAFDYLKIDGDFIRDLPSDRTNQCIVESLAGMAAQLGKRTIAEHVGDEATLSWLRAHGVDYAQGFHIGRPTSRVGHHDPVAALPRARSGTPTRPAG